jgi:broad specificity phosphatase PhoE
VRHGENMANITGEFSHRVLDYSLNEKGVLQAQQTADYFADKHIEEIYASPLKRAKETAGIIADRLGLPVTIMENFREINVGDLDGKKGEDLWIYHNSIIRRWMNGEPEFFFPGGENYLIMSQRFLGGIKQIFLGKEYRKIILVGHAGIFNCTILEYCKNINPQTIFTAQNNNCSITTMNIETNNGTLQASMEKWAYFGHLHGLAAEFVPPVPHPQDKEKRDAMRLWQEKLDGSNLK